MKWQLRSFRSTANVWPRLGVKVQKLSMPMFMLLRKRMQMSRYNTQYRLPAENINAVYIVPNSIAQHSEVIAFKAISGSQFETTRATNNNNITLCMCEMMTGSPLNVLHGNWKINIWFGVFFSLLFLILFFFLTVSSRPCHCHRVAVSFYHFWCDSFHEIDI